MEPIRKKLVIVGDGACGKTCLVIVFSKGKFLEETTTVPNDIIVKDISVDGNAVELVLWDTAGQEDFDELRPYSYTGTDVMLIAFSIDNPDSFENISERWAPEVHTFCPKVPVVLVGNKTDLRNDPATIAELKEMNQTPLQVEDGQAMAEKIKAVTYIECSAKNNEGVDEVFVTATRVALQAKKKHKNKCLIM